MSRAAGKWFFMFVINIMAEEMQNRRMPCMYTLGLEREREVFFKNMILSWIP